ncbi:hypothetical protein FRB98_007839 [Tulasnella sp. 332]|nr:hypothetical protein FRB98_007839 [Tulasnella sp. 332]
MSTPISARSAITMGAISVVSGLIAYAAYFDYKRRNDPSFRKKLRKEKRRVDRSKPDNILTPGSSSRNTADIKEALAMIRNEQLPSSAEQKEQYFMESVQMGEQLATQGPAFEIPAALAFYRALRVYPSPVELIMIYQKTVPEPVFKIVMEMTSLDVSTPEPETKEEKKEEGAPASRSPSPPRRGQPKNLTSPHYPRNVERAIASFVLVLSHAVSITVKQRAEGYYEKFPETSFYVSVAQVPLNDPQSIDGKPVKKSVLVASKDFAPGDVIYKETPIVMALDVDLQLKGLHCSQCFKAVSASQATEPSSDALNPAYCSGECEVQASTQHHTLLFGSNPPVIVEGTNIAIDASKVEARKAAQQKLVESIRATGKVGLLLVARFIARMVGDETKKLSAAASAGANTSDDYSLFDHIERLRYLEIPDADCAADDAALTEVLKLSAEGLEEFLKNGRYAMLLGKMAYNAIGVTFSTGRDDKPESSLRVEEQEWTRTPYGTKKQIGTGLYFVSSYMSHSCSPTVQPSFPAGTNELHLIANSAIKKGDELTMAYVDVQGVVDASAIDNRRTRRQELARGWRFACACARCQAEAPTATATEAAPKEDVHVEGPGAQVEEAVQRFETGEAGPELRSKAEADDVE